VAARAQRGNGLAERADQAAHLAPARARQDKKRLNAIIGKVARGALRGGGALDILVRPQPMADIGSCGAAKPFQFLRLERQDAQDAIDVRAHGRRPAGPPCPNAGADIMDDGDRRIGGAHLPRHAQRKVRAVYGDEAVGLFRRDVRGRLADPSHQPGQVAQDRAQPHKRHLARIEQRGKAQRLKVPAADADKLHPAARGALQRRHEVRAEQVARFLARDDGDLQRPFIRHAAFPSAAGRA